VFVGYSLESKRYKLIVSKIRKLIVNWNVIFNEEPLMNMEQRRLHNKVKPNVKVFIHDCTLSQVEGGGQF
jgi:hypothetical protein